MRDTRAIVVELLQGYYKGVTGVSQRCNWCHTGVLKGCDRGVTGLLYVCFKEVLQGCYRGVTVVVHGYNILLQGC